MMLGDAEPFRKGSIDVEVSWPTEGVARHTDLTSRGETEGTDLGLSKIVDASGADARSVHFADVSVSRVVRPRCGVIRISISS